MDINPGVRAVPPSLSATTPPAAIREHLAASGSDADPLRLNDTLELSNGSLRESDALPSSNEGEELRQVFQDFVGQTLFGSMLASMRQTVGKPAYLHGGRTEEVFQKQLDQHIVEDLSDSTARTISDPMFELFHLQRRS